MQDTTKIHPITDRGGGMNMVSEAGAGILPHVHGLESKLKPVLVGVGGPLH